MAKTPAQPRRIAITLSEKISFLFSAGARTSSVKGYCREEKNAELFTLLVNKMKCIFI